jgi:hypothetical protein
MAKKTPRERRIEAVMDALRAKTHPLLRALPDLSIDLEHKPAPDAWLEVIAERPWPDAQTLRFIVRPNVDRDCKPADWRWLLVRVRLHAALNHFDPQRPHLVWSAACWAAAEALLTSFGVGGRPAWLAPVPQDYKLTDERALAERLGEEAPSPRTFSASVWAPRDSPSGAAGASSSSPTRCAVPRLRRLRQVCVRPPPRPSRAQA